MARPHPEVKRIAGFIEAIHHGRCAARILDEGIGAEPEFTLVVVPVWEWKLSQVNLGRKDRDTERGERFLMPVRLIGDAQDTSVQVYAPGEVPDTLTVRENGLGHTGTRRVRLSADVDAPVFDDEGSLTVLRAEPLTMTGVHDALSALVEKGIHARYDFMSYVEPWVMSELNRARSYLSNDIFTDSVYDGSLIVDQIHLEKVRDEMLLGTEEKPESHSFDRLVEQCLQPNRFEGKEPLYHVGQVIHFEALYKLRTSIGDPKIGSKIRKVARELNTDDIDVVIEEYRRRFPADGLSVRRAEAALTITPQTTFSTFDVSPRAHTAY